MRRLVAGVGGAVGLAWLVRRLRGPKSPAGTGPDPADELRRRLEEARALEAEREEFEAGETPVDSVDDRRRQVHERARSAIDEMRRE